MNKTKDIYTLSFKQPKPPPQPPRCDRMIQTYLEKTTSTNPYHHLSTQEVLICFDVWFIGAWMPPAIPTSPWLNSKGVVRPSVCTLDRINWSIQPWPGRTIIHADAIHDSNTRDDYEATTSFFKHNVKHVNHIVYIIYLRQHKNQSGWFICHLLILVIYMLGKTVNQILSFNPTCWFFWTL